MSAFFSTLVGILFSSIGNIFSPYVLLFLGIILFLNLVKLDTTELLSTFIKPFNLITLSIVKLVVIPLLMYGLALIFYPQDALPILLLSGVSTGLGAPFVANLIGAKLSLIVGTVVTTSIFVPFILPILVYTLFQSRLSIPVVDMGMLLSLALFVPLVFGGIVKKYTPRIAETLGKNSMAPSFALIFFINLVIFSKASNYFFINQMFVINTIIESLILFAVFGVIGYLISFTLNKDKKTKFSGFIVMTYINNILVVVLAQQFFGSQIAALATFYNIPYLIGIIILKKLNSVPEMRN
jgi:BASS family bile acid:Na+ symporter